MAYNLEQEISIGNFYFVVFHFKYVRSSQEEEKIIKIAFEKKDYQILDFIMNYMIENYNFSTYVSRFNLSLNSFENDLETKNLVLKVFENGKNLLKKSKK